MSSTSSGLVDFVVALDVVMVVLLSAYAAHEGILILLYFWHKAAAFLLGRLARARRRGAKKVAVAMTPGAPAVGAPAVGAEEPCDGAPLGRLPSITVQLPLYNERYVAERVIAAACALDYPRDLLQIQVLDDSTDDTSRIAQRAVQAARASGVDIELIHRDNRGGYKAGALANGLRRARGELTAIFDADFIPPRNFLQRVICRHNAFGDPRVGFVQTRWGHLNVEANAVTGAQVLLLDMHFVVEQFARSATGLKMNFNGSGGIWRRAAIEAAGGWQTDTLTEDLDLSYRAQVQGWRGLYLDGEVCPGELPSDLLAFKRQQARWARGSAQCLRKLAPAILLSDLPLMEKVAAVLHVSGYFSNVFSLMLVLITPLMLLLLGSRGMRALPHWLGAMSAVGLAPMLAMLVGQTAQGRFRHFVHSLPMAVVLGIGITVSNTAAVMAGLFAKASGEFVRTPKSVGQAARAAALLRHTPQDKGDAGAAGGGGAMANRQSYLLRSDWTLRVECAVGVYTVVACLVLAVRGDWMAVLPVLVYAFGFTCIVLGQLVPGFWSRAHGQQRKVASRLQSTK